MAYVAKDFDLVMSVHENEQGIHLSLDYRADLYEEATIARLLQHFQTLLEGVVADPDRAISQVPMLSEAERCQLLVDWNATRRDFPQDMLLPQLFEAQAQRTPDAIAVVFAGESLTYRQLNARANQLARYLQEQGVGPDVLVGIFLDRSLEIPVALLGVLKAGGAYLPLDPAFPAERLRFMLEDSRAPLLITRRQLVGQLPPCDSKPICLDSAWEEISRQASDSPLSQATPEHLAYVIYTSGSTGRPKGVQIPQRAVVNFLWSMAREPGLAPSNVLLSVTTLSFDIFGLELYLPLLTGARLVLADRDTVADPVRLQEQLTQSGATVMQATPATWRMLLQAGWRGSPNLKILVGGEALGPDLARQLLHRGSALWNLYGPTETTIWSTACRMQQGFERITIGRPIANTQVYLLDKHLEPVPVGVPGELYIGGDGLARGYLNRPDLTAERFVRNPFAGDPASRMYRTGDCCRYLPDGSIEFLGRRDEQVKIRGFRIELGEIEAALRQRADVRDAVVAACDDPTGGKQLVAYVVAEGETRPAATELRRFLGASLPDYMIPSVFMPLDALPLMPNGKINRRALPAPDRSRQWAGQARAFVAPRTATEQQLATIWSAVLGIERVGITDNFFDLGGHSLLAIQVISRINRDLDLSVALRELFETATLEAFAERVETARRAGSRASLPAIRSAPRDVALPLSFGQEALWVISRLEDGPSPYAMFPAARIKGPLNVPAFERAFNELLRRHESLRTTFREDEGRPVQVVAPYAPRALSSVDLSGLPAEEREEQTRRYAWSESRRLKMDLSKGPLLRMELLRLGDEEHVVVMGMHHIIYDGWSMNVLGRDLFLAYRAFAAGLPSPLPDLPVQYADFAVWQRERLQGDVLAGLRNYWLKQLEGLPALELPTDRARSAVRAAHGGACKRALPGDLCRAVKQLGRAEGATPFMTLLAALQVLLQRYSGQEDFPIGTPVGGRLRPEMEPLIGYFVNALVLRADLSGDPSFRELLGARGRWRCRHSSTRNSRSSGWCKNFARPAIRVGIPCSRCCSRCRTRRARQCSCRNWTSTGWKRRGGRRPRTSTWR